MIDRARVVEVGVLCHLAAVVLIDLREQRGIELERTQSPILPLGVEQGKHLRLRRQAAEGRLIDAEDGRAALGLAGRVEGRDNRGWRAEAAAGRNVCARRLDQRAAGGKRRGRRLYGREVPGAG